MNFIKRLSTIIATLDTYLCGISTSGSIMHDIDIPFDASPWIARLMQLDKTSYMIGRSILTCHPFGKMSLYVDINDGHFQYAPLSDLRYDDAYFVVYSWLDSALKCIYPSTTIFYYLCGIIESELSYENIVKQVAYGRMDVNTNSIENDPITFALYTTRDNSWADKLLGATVREYARSLI